MHGKYKTELQLPQDAAVGLGDPHGRLLLLAQQGGDTGGWIP